MNSGKRPCETRLKPDNSVFARWFLRNYPREAPPARACLSSLNRWPSPMKIFRPRRRIWPAVFIGNTAAKEDRGSILSRISSSPRTHRCNAIIWQQSIAAISGATSRAYVYFCRSKPTICPSNVRIACQRNRVCEIGRRGDQLIPGAILAVYLHASLNCSAVGCLPLVGCFHRWLKTSVRLPSAVLFGRFPL